MAAPSDDGFLSDHDEDLFADYNTIQTAPLSPSHQYSTFVTQPTQPLTSPLYERPSSPATVQVRASSPAIPPTPAPVSSNGLRTSPINQGAFNRGLLANSIAPPGTQYRPPPIQAQSQARQRSQTVDYDSDKNGRVYDSSDDELAEPSADIRPSILQRNGQPLSGSMMGNGHGQNSTADFSRFGYTAPVAPMSQKRSSDAMANAYGSGRPPRPFKIQRQEGPMKARPVEPDIILEDIHDWEVKKKVEMMLEMLPGRSIRRCRDALLKAKGSPNDAVMLISREEEEAEQLEQRRSAIDLTNDDELAPAPTRSFKKPGSKPIAPSATIKPTIPSVKRAAVPTQSIAQKWASTQNAKPSNEPRAVEEVATIAPETSSPIAPITTPKPIRKRLVRGRRDPSSPILISSPAQAPVQLPAPKAGAARRKVVESDEEEEAVLLDSDDDSGVEVVSDRNEEIEDKLLKFLNTCSVADLIDISNQPSDVAKLVLDQRPFRDLDVVRQIKTPTTTTSKNGKKITRMKEIGDRLVDVCLEMYTGYEAVDQLVAKCEELGKPIADELKNWGFNAFGSSSQGELQMVELPDSHDSGIGTPSSSIGDSDDLKSSRNHRKSKLLQQPSIMSPTLVMKDYQVAGLNWLALLFSKKLSCILADDMGLGKTCQVIAFLSHLYEIGVKGPHLVVVPGSTLENWLREFRNFCPELRVVPYYGALKERAEQRQEIEEDLSSINVIVTTYNMAQNPKDAKFLRQIKPVVCCYDEGHALKNSESQRYKELMRIPAQFRLLLTGTPLQNNLQELISLLSFIMPKLFLDRRDDLQYIFKHKAKTTDDVHTALLSEQRITRARTMMTPFILRRKKHQVLRHLPNKTCRVEYCQLSNTQQEIYDAELTKVREALQERAALKDEPKAKRAALSTKTKINNLMDLRKAAIHPLLFRRTFADATLRKMAKAWLAEPEAIRLGSDVNLVYEDLSVMTDFELNRFCLRYPDTVARYALKEKDQPWLDSGKVTTLLSLLGKYIANGDRALIFSQFTMAMDILELVFEHENITYSRLDGSTSMAERQPLIDQFYADTSISAFMLSTKAGGAGINLACANKVIIFDGSFNPQDDVQAENRAHRVGQTRDVEVVRLVCKGTVEEQIYKLGETKLVLDERVAGAGAATGGVEDAKSQEAAESAGMEAVAGMLMESLNDKTEKGIDKAEEEKQGSVKVESTPATPTRKLKLSMGRRGNATTSLSTANSKDSDVKDEYIKGLKEAGLDVSIA